MVLLVFLGNSILGILSDAWEAFPGKKTKVVTRDGDRLPVPEGLESVAVSDFRPEPGVMYTVIANGGTSAQLVPTLKALVQAGAAFEVYNLQRDGVDRLW